MLNGLQNKSKHVLQLVGFTDFPELAILSKFYVNGPLSQKIRDQGFVYPAGFVDRVVRGIVAGMEVVHRANIVHFDLKPANVLLDENWDAVISDFGVANVVGENINTRLVAGLSNPNVMGFTPAYASAEVYDRAGVTMESDKKADIFAFGISLWEILERKPLWVDQDGNKLQATFIRDAVERGERPRIGEDTRSQYPAHVKVMQEAWAQSPDYRPTFSAIKAQML